MTQEEALRFLIALQAISDRFGVAIRGCGCCGSPWLERRKDGVYALRSRFVGDERKRPSFGYTRE